MIHVYFISWKNEQVGLAVCLMTTATSFLSSVNLQLVS